jgi:hypothetical protein
MLVALLKHCSSTAQALLKHCSSIAQALLKHCSSTLQAFAGRLLNEIFR